MPTPAPHPAQGVPADARPVDPPNQLIVEACKVEPEPGGVPLEVGIVQGPLALEQEVVHRPEATLGSGRLGSVLGVRVDAGKREVAEDEAERIAQALLDLPDDGVRRNSTSISGASAGPQAWSRSPTGRISRVASPCIMGTPPCVASAPRL